METLKLGRYGSSVGAFGVKVQSGRVETGKKKPQRARGDHAFSGTGRPPTGRVMELAIVYM